MEPARKDVYDVCDELLTRKGDPVRTLTLSLFALDDPYILVTTDFTDGPADFENTSIEMLVALDVNGREVPGVFANGRAIWAQEMVDFRGWGLIFDHGFGRDRLYLDTSNQDGQSGLIAYTRGHNEYLPGALCETEPQVREFWLSCIEEMLDAGVDGIDFREENHSTHTDYPEDYGFNPAVLEACQQRGGVDLATIAQVRGEAYTEFLRQAKAMIAARGKCIRINSGFCSLPFGALSAHNFHAGGACVALRSLCLHTAWSPETRTANPSLDSHWDTSWPGHKAVRRVPTPSPNRPCAWPSIQSAVGATHFLHGVR